MSLTLRQAGAPPSPGLDAQAAVIKTREAGYDVRFTVEDLEESAKKPWELIDATPRRSEPLASNIYMGGTTQNRQADED
jgi:hypothetical protein